MKKRLVDGIEVRRSSGNVFADLELPDAEKLKIKTGLVVEIMKAMRQHNLTQQEAAKRMGLTQPKVSGMMRGDFSNLSERIRPPTIRGTCGRECATMISRGGKHYNLLRNKNFLGSN